MLKGLYNFRENESLLNIDIEDFNRSRPREDFQKSSI